MRVKETWRRYSAAQVKDFLRVGYEFDFSKRTDLYTSLTRFQSDASASGTFVGRIGAGVPAGLTTATDRSVTEFVLGVRHTF